MRILKCGLALPALLTLWAGAMATEGDKGTKDDPTEVVINIVKKGTMAKYVKEGDAEEKDVTVIVGQTVTWKNMGNKPHTATSMKMLEGKALFNTGDIDVDKSKSIKFDDKLFKDAGGVAGGEVKLEYFCAIHGAMNMKSSITLKSAEKKKE